MPARSLGRVHPDHPKKNFPEARNRCDFCYCCDPSPLPRAGSTPTHEKYFWRPGSAVITVTAVMALPPGGGSRPWPIPGFQPQLVPHLRWHTILTSLSYIL